MTTERRVIALEPERKRFARSRPRTGPTLVQIGLTERCNYRCLFCMEHTPLRDQPPESSRPMLDREVFSRLVADLSSLNCKWMQFVGLGEPLMHKGALEMMREARDARIWLRLTTNGALMSEQMAEALAELPIYRFQVSLNASSESVYERVHVTSRPGALGRIVRGVAAFARASERIGANAEVILSYVAFRDNADDIEGMVEVARAARATHVAFIRMGVFDQVRDRSLDQDEWAQALERMRAVDQQLRACGIETNVESLEAPPSPDGCSRLYSRIPCYMGHHFALIHADGRIEPCSLCPVNMGNLHEQSFRQIWRGPRYAQLRRECLALPRGRFGQLLAIGRRPRLLDGCDCFTRCAHGPENVQIYNRLHRRAAVDLARTLCAPGDG
jgi:MoaA/NifB/PqqE/SkfB family radical SAM enzyme